MNKDIRRFGISLVITVLLLIATDFIIGFVADKVVDLEFEPLSEEAFGKLMASNDWTIEKAMTIGALIVE